MFSIKLLIAAVIIQLATARESEYIDINVGEGGLHIVHLSVLLLSATVRVLSFISCSGLFPKSRFSFELSLIPISP